MSRGRAAAGFTLLATATLALGGACEGSGDFAPRTSRADAGAVVQVGAGDDAGLCVNGTRTVGAYPTGPRSVALRATLPDLSFDALAPDGSPSKLALHEYFEPCAPQARMLVLRVGAAWCGTCRWHYAHTAALKALDVGPRLQLVDLELANEDGFAPQPSDVRKLAALIDAPERVGADPKFQLGAVLQTPAPLPLYVFVDTRTMVAVDVASNPDPETLALRVHQAFAEVDGAPLPTLTPPKKEDGLFFPNEWDLLRDMTLPGAPPPDPTNAKADDPAAAALGKRFFSDASLSPGGAFSCATCHAPSKRFQDGLPVSRAIGTTDRNAPGLGTAAHQRWQFWDGRADTLWMQALEPIEQPRELGSSRLFVAHRVFDAYRADFEAVWGPLAPLGDGARFPPAGKPGDAAYDKLTGSDQLLVTRVLVDVGKSIAAYERTLRETASRFDAYVGGDRSALSPAEKGGLAVFFRLGCAQCHWGPRLSDDAFHATRFPTGRADGKGDVGRQDGQALLIQSPFISSGPFSDAPTVAHAVGLTLDPAITGAFKTPTLRGVAGTAPYGHGGALATLDDVVTLYSQGGLPKGDPRAAGTAPRWLVTFDHNAASALVPFLKSLDGDVTDK